MSSDKFPANPPADQKEPVYSKEIMQKHTFTSKTQIDSDSSPVEEFNSADLKKCTVVLDKAIGTEILIKVSDQSKSAKTNYNSRKEAEEKRHTESQQTIDTTYTSNITKLEEEKKQLETEYKNKLTTELSVTLNIQKLRDMINEYERKESDRKARVNKTNSDKNLQTNAELTKYTKTLENLKKQYKAERNAIIKELNLPCRIYMTTGIIKKEAKYIDGRIKSIDPGSDNGVVVAYGTSKTSIPFSAICLNSDNVTNIQTPKDGKLN